MAATAASERTGSRFPWSTVIAKLRLVTGLILLAFVTSHLINHTFGLWSLDSLDAARRAIMDIWRVPPGSLVLYTALGLHVTIALRAIYLRDAFIRMSWPEVGQLTLGLLTPMLLLGHVIATSYLGEFHGVRTDYTYVLLNLWVFNPWLGAQQALALLVAWTHGCIGIHLWLRYRNWYKDAAPWLFATALLVPALAMSGYIAAGMEIRQLAVDREWLHLAVAGMALPPQAQIQATLALIDHARLLFAAMIGGALVARWIRLAYELRHRGVRIRYGSGRAVAATKGMTVLEVSRTNGIPHASVCGGRGRCSTCRIRINHGLDQLPAPSETEAKVLTRVAAPPNVRLACQTEVIDGLEVTPLLPPHNAGMDDTRGGPNYLQGQELEIAVLFADIRGFTRVSEKRLPYDVVFILNRYFAEMGAAIEGAGGRIDKFIGDGIMALFGVDSDPATGARQALAAAREMGRRLDDLNASMASDLKEPLRIGIGIHIGPAIVGEMGYGQVRGVTAVGDTVNTASRLETLTKEHPSQLIVSSALAERAGVELPGAEAIEVDVRGRETRLGILVVQNASDLPN